MEAGCASGRFFFVRPKRKPRARARGSLPSAQRVTRIPRERTQHGKISRVRLAFAAGNMFMWLAGAWLYLLIPSLGPAYRFPEIWFAHTENLGRTQFLQAMLMKNYQNLLRIWSGEPAGPVRVLFGIGAFPSLHVAFQTLVFLWMRRLWMSGQLLFGIFLVLIFLGSIVTGWHYLLDSIAGLVLAGIAFAGSMRLFRMKRWLRLRRN